MRPPDSLLEAMRIFFLGVSAGIILDRSEGNRSMMVHPSREQLGIHNIITGLRQSGRIG